MTGIIPNLPAADYHARPEISKHGLDDFHRCPAWFKYRRENPHETTPALRWGSIVDEAVFTPAEFAANSVVLPADAPSRPTERSRKAKKPSEETIRAVEFWDKFDAENAGKVDLRAEFRLINLRFRSNVIDGDYEMGRVLITAELGDERP